MKTSRPIYSERRFRSPRDTVTMTVAHFTNHELTGPDIHEASLDWYRRMSRNHKSRKSATQGTPARRESARATKKQTSGGELAMIKSNRASHIMSIPFRTMGR